MRPFVVHQFHRMLAALKGATLPGMLLLAVLLFCETAWLAFLAPTDTARYQCYALTFWLGSHATALLPQAQCAFLHSTTTQPAFHMLPLEYPPFTILPFSLPLPVPPPYYALSFGLCILLIAVLIFWFLSRSGPRRSAWMFALYLGIGASAFGQFRFDLLPAALTLFCVVAAEHKRWAIAYSALALGVLLKLYPILLLPALFMAEQQALGRFYTPPSPQTLQQLPQQIWYTLREAGRWQWRHCLIFLGVLLGITGVFALISFQGAVISPLSYFALRPAQIESLQSTLLWIAHLQGFRWQIIFSFGSLNIVSGLAGGLSLVGTTCLVLGFLYITWLQWRAKITFVQAMIALLLVLIATGKVFSPQYLIWLIPLLAYAGAFDTFWLLCWGTVSLLTTFSYIFFYSRLPNPNTAAQLVQSLPGFFETLAVRNALFLFITLAYLFNWFRARQDTSVSP